MKYHGWTTIIAAMIFCACGSGNETATDETWRDRALMDLDFIHAQLGEHHPGPVDTLNPWFGDWYERGYEAARGRAESITDYAGYYFAVQYYMVGFQDGHLGALGDYRIEADLDRRWPGFLVKYDRGAFLVMGNDNDDPELPPNGARLLSCDGASAAAMADSMLETYVGLWSINGVRPRLAPWLLVDEGNPWIRRRETCVFEVGEGRSERRLNWRPIDQSALSAVLEAAVTARKPPIGIRKFGERSWWVTLSSFNSSDSTVMSAIDEVVSVINARRAELLAAEVIVFDVRGNQGGSSTNGLRVAEALWGETLIDALPPLWEGIDWRVSAGNADFLRNSNLARRVRNYGEDHEATRSYRAFVDAYDRAVSGNELFFHQAAGRPTQRATASNPVGGRVFFLTDTWCASACLGFADLMAAIDGVTHIGAETSADAIYIDNRSVALPSEQGRLGFSMKVYRGRVRGHNVSYVPEFFWEGSMTDDEGLEHWVSELAQLHPN